MPQRSIIEWTEYTSNPIRGQCQNACWYCYAERRRKQLSLPEEITWHPEELTKIQSMRRPATIFMGSMHDIFGSWIPTEWISQIIDTIMKCKHHTFLFLTKNFARYCNFFFPENCYIGITFTSQRDIKNDTFDILRNLSIEQNHLFLSFEPLLGDFHEDECPIRARSTIIIGAMTGPESGDHKPLSSWGYHLINIARSRSCRIFLKDNLKKIYPDLPDLRETAWEIS